MVSWKKKAIKIYRLIYFRVRLWVRRPIDELTGKRACFGGRIKVNAWVCIDGRVDMYSRSEVDQ